jgi:hypothetical protein
MNTRLQKIAKLQRRLKGLQSERYINMASDNWVRVRMIDSLCRKVERRIERLSAV